MFFPLAIVLWLYYRKITNKQLNDTKLPVNKAKIIDIVSNISH